MAGAGRTQRAGARDCVGEWLHHESARRGSFGLGRVQAHQPHHRALLESTVERVRDRAWAAALTLILIVMALNLIARLVARFFAPKYGR